MMSDLDVVVTYTGHEANLRPVASAFVRMMKSKTNPDGTFIDPDLEAEFQEWMKQQEAEKARNKNAPLMLEPSTGQKGLFA